MATDVKLRALGVYKGPNRLSNVPVGAAEVADEVTADKDGLLTVRTPVFSDSSILLSLDTDANVLSMGSFKTGLLAHLSSGDVVPGSTTGYIGGPWSEPAAGFPVTFRELTGKGLFNTATGVWRVNSASGGTAYLSGVRRMPDIWMADFENVSTNPDAGPFWLGAGRSVAYRAVLGRRDSDGTYVLGPPSGRYVFTNSTAGDVSVNLSIFTHRDMVANADFIWLFRTKDVAAGVLPGDDMSLVYEVRLTTIGSSSTFNIVTIIDSTPSGAITSQPLYTNPLREGPLATNDRPPYAKAMAVFNEQMFYANTRTLQRLQVRMLAPPTADSVITIGGRTYTAKVTPVANSDFQLSAAVSVSQAIEETARSLIAAVNRVQSGLATPEMVAAYLSGEDDDVGLMLFESLTVTTSYPLAGSSQSFTMASSELADRVRFNPALTATSSAETKKNRVYWSKQGNGEAVPITNYRDLGSADMEILAMATSRDSLFVFKQDGIWRITTDGVRLRSEAFDVNARCLSARTVASMDNSTFALTSRGIVQVSDNGVTLISNNIDDEVQRWLGDPNMYASACAVGHDSSLTYRISIYDREVQFAGDSAPPNCTWVYSTVTGEWTRHLRGYAAMVTHPTSGVLYMAPAYGGVAWHENDDPEEPFDLFSYEVLDSNVQVDGVYVTTYTTAGITEGCEVLYQDTWTPVTIIDTATFRIDGAFENVEFGEFLEVRRAVRAEVRWLPLAGNSAAEMKHWQEAVVVTQADTGSLDQDPPLDPDFIFWSENAEEENAVDITTPGTGGNPFILRCHVPRNHRRGTHIRVGIRVSGRVSILGLDVQYAPYSRRSTRDRVS
jgi:hypothetical protein